MNEMKKRNISIKAQCRNHEVHEATIDHTYWDFVHMNVLTHQ